MVWSIVAKQFIKQGAKQAVKKGGKKIATKGAKAAAGGTFMKILDYTDPFYWIGRGLKASKKAILKTTKKKAFKKAAAKTALMGGAGLTFGSVLSSVSATITAPEFVIPALLGATVGAYGFYKVNTIFGKKKDSHDADSSPKTVTIKHETSVDLKELKPKQIKQIKKLTPAQIQALRAKEYAHAA